MSSFSDGTWQPDRFLDGYQLRTLDLGPDPDGESPITATLVRRDPARRTALTDESAGAVLYVHGRTDYFFHEPLAIFFAARGYTFYAIDLRKCGRSLQEHHTGHYITDLSRYDLELGLALDIITEEVGAQTKVIVAAHSAGGLISALWLDRLRREDPARHRIIDGLLLNSPWFDLQGHPILRTLPATWLIKAVAAIDPLRVIPTTPSSAYGESLHDSAHGEWNYDLTVKPMGGFPVVFGFLDAIRDGQRKLHRGIDVGVPALVLRSDKTHFATAYSSETDRADVVLDVSQIARWSGCLGSRVHAVPIPDARHDVFLSVRPARELAYREVASWLTDVITPTTKSKDSL